MQNQINSCYDTERKYCYNKTYIYHMHKTGNNDDCSGYADYVYGDKFTWEYPGGIPVIFEPGRKYHIMFYAKMNNPGKYDGEHMVWVNGIPVLHVTSLELRRDSHLKFNTIGMETFHGGGDISYATSIDTFIDFGEFVSWGRNFIE